MRETLDQIDPKVVFVVTAVLLGVASEIGFRLARDGNEGKKGQVEALLASMLGLLALLLAFILSIVQDRYVERGELVVEQANAIDVVHLRAEMLPRADAAKVQKLLRDYVELHLSVKKRADIEPIQHEVEDIHHALWDQAVAIATAHPDSMPAAMFTWSVNQLIDVDQKRIAAAVYRRLPAKLLGALYMIALLAFFVQGHNGGLVRSRVPIAAVVVGVSVATVLTMIVDLDRPWQSGIHVNQQAIQNVRQTLVSSR